MELWTALADIPSRAWLWWMLAPGILGLTVFVIGIGLWWGRADMEAKDQAEARAKAAADAKAKERAYARARAGADIKGKAAADVPVETAADVPVETGTDVTAKRPSDATIALHALIGVAMVATAVTVTNMTPTDSELIVPEVVAYVEDTEDLSVLGGATYTYVETGGTVTAVGVNDDGTQFDVVVTWLPLQHADGQDLSTLPAKFEPVTVTLTERPAATN